MEKEKVIVEFSGYKCYVELNFYGNNRLALSLRSAVEDLEGDLFYGTPIATATVNLPNVNILSNQVIIKDYSENKGMLAALIVSGLVVEDDNSQRFVVGDGEAVVVSKSDKLLEMENEIKSFLKPQKKKKP